MLRASIAIVASATVGAGVVEPAWEFFLEDATFEWAFGAARNGALAAFVGSGVIAYVPTLAAIQRLRRWSARPGREVHR